MTSPVPDRTRSPRAVQRRRLSDEVAETLRDMILVGELVPDRKITQDELADELGVSTTPVREALLRLAAEGFVRISPNRAFSVIRSSPEDIQDVYWMHAVLAAELTRRACLHADAKLCAVVRQHGADYERAVHAGDVARMEEANWNFHRVINVAANAPRIRLTLATTLRFIPRGFYGMLPSWGPTSLHGHDAILRALESGDAAAAAAAADAHVRDAGETVTEFFTAKGYWTRPGAGPGVVAAAGSSHDAPAGLPAGAAKARSGGRRRTRRPSG